MTNDTTPTTHAAKAEAALRDGLPNTATARALLEIAEQLRLANLISLARGALPEHVPCEPDYTDVQERATAALVYLRRHVIPTGHPPVPEDYVTAHLLPDIAAALGIEPLDEQGLR